MVSALDRDVAYFQTGTMADEVLELPKSMLLALNIGLLPANEHLLVLDVGNSFRQPCHFLLRSPQGPSEPSDSDSSESAKNSGATIQELSYFKENSRRQIMNGAIFLAGLSALAYLALRTRYLFKARKVSEGEPK